MVGARRGGEVAKGSVENTLLVRRGLAKVDAATVLGSLEELDLSRRGGPEVVVVAALSGLERTGDVIGFATTAPAPAVRFLGQHISQRALERAIELLGDASNDPSLEQLSAAVDQMLGDGEAPGVVALMLACAAAEGVPASPHCRQLLEDRDELSLPELNTPAHASTMASSAHHVEDAVRERRRQRRAAQRDARAKVQGRPPSRPSKGPPAPTASESARRAASRPTASSRRSSPLTPAELSEFDANDPRAGDVVWMRVDHGPTAGADPGDSDKERPVVIVAASESAVLVRPVYSREAEGRRLLVGWNRVGLAGPSYVADARVRIEGTGAGPPRLLGRLGDAEWNALW
jgi:hypothetical protein